MDETLATFVHAMLNTVGPEEKEIRDYLGASVSGTQCHAALSYRLRGYAGHDIPPTTQRIFNIGKALEPMIAEELRQKLPDGFVFLPTDPKTGQQFGAKAYGGLLSCHMDGVLETPTGFCVVEIKTMKAEKWTKFSERGSYVSHPGYYAQVQTMMHLTGMDCALLIGLNKDTAEYHVEFIPYIAVEAKAIESRMVDVISGSGKRITKFASSFTCRFCDFKKFCWEGHRAEPTCRNCQFAIFDHTKDPYQMRCGLGHAYGTPCLDHVEFQPS